MASTSAHLSSVYLWHRLLSAVGAFGLLAAFGLSACMSDPTPHPGVNLGDTVESTLADGGLGDDGSRDPVTPLDDSYSTPADDVCGPQTDSDGGDTAPDACTPSDGISPDACSPSDSDAVTDEDGCGPTDPTGPAGAHADRTPTPRWDP